MAPQFSTPILDDPTSRAGRPVNDPFVNSRPPTSNETVDRPNTLAKIVATIGPACDSPEMVEKMIRAGVDVFRFNFSHGEFTEHYQRLMLVRETAYRMGCVVGCLGDLSGPKLRVSEVPEDGIYLAVGQDVEFRDGVETAFIDANAGNLPVFGSLYQGLVSEVKPGQRVLVNDGAIRMLAVDASPGRLRCRVTVGGLVTSRKGINLPETDLSVPAITERDWRCVEWAVGVGMDFLALSFVRRAKEIIELKDALWGMCPADRGVADLATGSLIPVIAKIEKPQALENIDEIVDAADGIMVARGDLGVEMDIARVPVAQKRILNACEERGKPAIVATQMLETMITNAIPTRAEASDVANAIFDNTDAVMLSGETAVGAHPVLAVETMRRIIAAAEDHTLGYRRHNPPVHIQAKHRLTASLAHGAWQTATDLGARAIVCWSENGGTARYLSQNDFNVPIVAYSSNPRAVSRMTLLRSVTPIQCDPPEGGRLSEWNRRVDRDLLSLNMVQPGDWIVMLAGRPLGMAKSTNTLAVHRVGEDESGYHQL